jgi:glycosyltransferase involved in cell wall biosynthesis
MSASSAPTIWLNVSTLMNWGRPPVGIVRVEQEYCRWLLARPQQDTGERVRFCAFDRASGGFVEVAREWVAAKLDPSLPQPPPVRPPLPLWKRRVKGALEAVGAFLPDPWVPKLATLGRRGYHELLVARARLRKPAAQTSPLPVSAPTARIPPLPPIFSPGDRWVSLGLDWEYLDQEVLYRLKRQLDLKITLICYDVIPVLYPHLVVLPPGGFGAYLVDMAWCADAVLCISEHTRRDCERVLKSLGAPVPPTHVIRLGSGIDTKGEGVPPPNFAHGPNARPFVLFVSTIERRKNHEVLYRAWTRLRDQGMVPHRLVFVGMQGWGINDLLNDLRLDPRIQDDIICMNDVSDDQLAWLYRQCAFTVFPSLYEGWGLPVVESLAWGKFCLASNAASLPEAGGPWAEYLDPWDLPAWVDRLAHHMRNPQKVAALNARISSEFNPPTWTATAQAIHEVVLAATHLQDRCTTAN